MIKLFEQWSIEKKLFDSLDKGIKNNKNIIILNSDKNTLNLVQYYFKKHKKRIVPIQGLKNVYEPELNNTIKAHKPEYVLFSDIDNIMFNGSKHVPENIIKNEVPFVIISKHVEKRQIPKIFKNYELIMNSKNVIKEKKSFEEIELERFMELVHRHKKYHLKDIGVIATPKGNWRVYSKNKDTGITVPGHILSDSTIDEFGLKQYIND